MNINNYVRLLSETSRPRLAEGVRLHVDRLGGETVLLYPEGVLRLNQTARDFLAQCDGHRSLAEIAAALAESYYAPADRVLADLAELLATLRDRHLVREANEGEDP